MTYRLENMTDQHRAPVIDIFNHYVVNSMAAYPDKPVGYDRFDRFLQAAKDYPAVVILDEADQVVGFAFLHHYRPEDTFRRAAVITYFLHPDHTGKGLGTCVLERFIEEAKAQNIRTLLANISSQNEMSLQFHRKHGFRECGRFERIGSKFGQEFDVVWMQLDLSEAK
jgi:phosphinothricin acetyltransferase